MIEITYGTKADDYFVFTYSGVSDLVFGRRGNDMIDEGSDFQNISDDIFFGNGGDDTIISRSGHDIIRAGRGDDVAHIYGGEPVMAHGGGGHDVLYVHTRQPGDDPGFFKGHGGTGSDIGDYRGFEEIIFL